MSISSLIQPLEKLVSIKGGKRLPKGENLQSEPTEHPYIRVRDMGQRYISKDNMQYVRNDTFQKIKRYIVEENDVVISIVGTIGLISVINAELHNASLTENCTKLSGLDKIDAIYLYYFLTSAAGQREINQATIGAVQLKLPIYNIEKLQVFWPERAEREKIVSLLNNYDKKLEINFKLNKTLDLYVQTIYDGWFRLFEYPDKFKDQPNSFNEEFRETEYRVATIDWKAGKLSDLINIKYGKDHRKLNDGSIPVYGSGGIIRYVEAALYDRESVLIPRKGTLNNIFYINEPFWSVDTMFYSEMKYDNIARFVYCFMLTKDLVSMNIGTAVPSMTTDILLNIQILVPPLEIIYKFDELVKPFFDRCKSNSIENTHLVEMRNYFQKKYITDGFEKQMENKGLEETL